MQRPGSDQEHLNASFFRKFRATLLNSQEGHIFLTGLVISALYLFWLVFNEIWNPRQAPVFVAMTITHVLFGRAAGMSLGYTVGFGHVVVILLNLVIETIQVLLFYPLFVFSWRQLLIINRLKNMMDRIHQAAASHQHVIHRYGLIGLFVFVWIPFWMTGSAVGCVIGFLLNLRPWMTIGVVLGGAYMAIVSWAFLLQELHHRASEFGPYASIGILAMIILLALVGRFVYKKQRDHQSHP